MFPSYLGQLLGLGDLLVGLLGVVPLGLERRVGHCEECREGRCGVIWVSFWSGGPADRNKAQGRECRVVGVGGLRLVFAEWW